MRIFELSQRLDIAMQSQHYNVVALLIYIHLFGSGEFDVMYELLASRIDPLIHWRSVNAM